MKPVLLTLLLVFAPLLAVAEDKPKPVTIASMLGQGFGKIIVIEGKVIDDTDTRMRAHMGKKLLEVQKVNGQKMANPPQIQLSSFSFSKVDIPERGTLVQLRGYETGGFSGIPGKAFDDIPMVATTGYFFKTQFMVTKVLRQVKAPIAQEIGAPPARK